MSPRYETMGDLDVTPEAMAVRFRGHDAIGGKSMAWWAGTLSRNEQGVVVAAALAALLSLFPGYITVTFDGRGFDASYTAWTGSATVGMVLLLGGAALIVLEAFSEGTLPEVVPWHLISVAAAAFGTFLVTLRALTAGSDLPGAHVGPGWSGWLLIAVSICLTAFAVLSFRDSEDALEFRS
jgi:hypothetical protein